jgi:vacuolar-type H+-ATPase subunit H
MEREEIVREDFPSARKGWDPEAVKAHLNALAERLPKGSGSIGEVAADRVGKIVGVAEATAAEIEAEAGKQAEAIVAAARGEAEEIISRARSEAQARIEQAQKAVEGLVTQAEDLRGKVGSLGESLTGEVRTRLADATGSDSEAEPEHGATEPDVVEPEPEPPPASGLEQGSAPQPVVSAGASTEDLIAQLKGAAAPAAAQSGDVSDPEAVASPQATADQAPGAADPGAVRLVAMNLALEGAEPDAIAAQLEAEFGRVKDSDALIEDVLARAGRS